MNRFSPPTQEALRLAHRVTLSAEGVELLKPVAWGPY
jgi:hypothetical protein